MTILRDSFLTVLYVGLLAVPTYAMGDGHGDGPDCAGRLVARPSACPRPDDIKALPSEMLENNVFFPAGGAVLDPVSVEQLTLLATVLQQEVLQGACLQLIGHSDASGPADVNARLSKLRAETVRDFLVGALAPANIPIEVMGKGETELIPDLAKNSTAHRRVAINARYCGDVVTSGSGAAGEAASG